MRLILCPGSAENQKFKRWGIENFVQTADSFIGLGFEVIIILGPEEGYLESYFKDYNIIRSPSFEDLVILGKKSDLIVCNDSFLLHFFAFIDSKVLGVFGPTKSTRTLPPNADIIESDLPSKTRPCWGTKNYGRCDNGYCSCFDGLSPKILLKKCLDLLHKSKTY